MEKYISNFAFCIGFVSFIIVIYYIFKNKKYGQLKDSEFSEFSKFWTIMWVIFMTVSAVIDGSWSRGITNIILFSLMYYIEFVHESTKILIMDSSASNMTLFNNKKLVDYLKPHFGNKKFILLESKGDGVFRSDVVLNDLTNFKFISSGRDYVQECIDWVDVNFLNHNRLYILTDGYLFEPLDFKKMKNKIIILKTVKEGIEPKANKEMTIIGKDINPIK